jgi:hypothetical protein
LPDLSALPLCLIFILSLGLIFGAVEFGRYSGRMKGRQSGAVAYVTGFLIASVILLIQDLDRPGVGLITVSQQPMIDTIKSLESEAP